MVVCLWSNNFGQSGCQHLALTITCLCVKNAAFLGKEGWENQELLRRTTKPATSERDDNDEIIVSEGNVVPGKRFSNCFVFCLCRDVFWVDKNTSIAS